MANLKQTSITGSGETSLLISGSSILMPGMSGSVDSGSVAQMYVDISPTAGLTMHLTQAGSFGSATSPYTCLGAFAQSGNLINARRSSAGFGDATAGVLAGGANPSAIIGSTEEFDGSTWSAGTALSVSRTLTNGAGSSNAGIVASGATPAYTKCVEEYDGSAWSTGGVMINDHSVAGFDGTQNAAIYMGGDSNSSPYQMTETEEYNGSAWATSTALPTGNRGNTYSGTVTTGTAFGYGNSACYNAYNWDGTVFTQTGDMIFQQSFGGGMGASSQGGSNVTALGGCMPSATQTKTQNFTGDVWSIGRTSPVATMNTSAMGDQSTGKGMFAGGRNYPTNDYKCTTYIYEKSLTSPFTYNPEVSTDNWSGGTNMIQATRKPGGTGTQNAALASGGSSIPDALSNTEEYNGSSWSAGGALITARCAGASAGTQNAAFYAGGADSPSKFDNTEEYNGSTWAAGGAIITVRSYLSAGGTQNAGLAIAGYTPTAVSCVEEYDGSTWATGGALSIARYSAQANLGNSQTDGAVIGGAPSSTTCGSFETWDGTAASTGPDLAICSSNGAGGVESSDNIINQAGSSPHVSTTQKYNGTSWSTAVLIPSMVGTNGKASAGSGTAALLFAGVKAPNNPVNETYLFNQLTDVCSTTPYCLSTWSMGANTITGFCYSAGFGLSNAAVVTGGCGAQTTTNNYDGETWTAGGALITGRNCTVGAGSQNAGLAIGGAAGSITSCVEEYDGEAFTAGGALINTRSQPGTAGTQNAAITFGGEVNNVGTTCAEEYDGSTWSTATRLIHASAFLAGTGTQNATLKMGGGHPGGHSCTEEYNGSTWASGNAMLDGLHSLAGAGTQTSGWAMGGYNNNTVVQYYDGNVWTMYTPLNFGTNGNSGVGSSAAGVNCAMSVGGSNSLCNTQKLEYGPYDLGVWSGVANLNTAVRDGVGGGTQNAAIQATGGTPSASGLTQTFDGSTWTTQTSAPISICESAGGGTQTAFYQATGYPANATTQLWDGSTWSTGNNVTQCTYGRTGSGDSSAGLLTGYQPTSNCTEEYDGTTWTAGGNAIVPKRYAGMNGTLNASISFGGQSPAADSDSCVEIYNGTSWSTGNRLVRAVSTPAEGGGRCKDEAIQIGGNINPAAGNSNVELYNGTAWSIGSYLPQPNKNGQTGGTQNAALTFGGDNDGTSLVQTYSFTTTNPVNKGLYCFAKTI